MKVRGAMSETYLRNWRGALMRVLNHEPDGSPQVSRICPRRPRVVGLPPHHDRSARGRRSQGLPFIYPDPRLRYCANFLHMMFSIPYQQYLVTPEVEDALNLVFILHGVHGRIGHHDSRAWRCAVPGAGEGRLS